MVGLNPLSLCSDKYLDRSSIIAPISLTRRQRLSAVSFVLGYESRSPSSIAKFRMRRNTRITALALAGVSTHGSLEGLNVLTCLKEAKGG